MKRVIDFNRLPKQEYMKPTMTVVMLRQRCQILAGSGPLMRSLDTNMDDEDEFLWGGGVNVDAR